MSTEPLDSAALYRLMVWLSPAFPVGAFSYSHGLEWLVEAGAVRDEASLQGWVLDVLARGSARSDAILFAHAYRATAEGADASLSAVAELAAALAPSAERHLEAAAQGEAFGDMAGAAWPIASLARLRAATTTPIVYPVAVAVAAADHGIPLRPALLAYLHAFAANLISAGVRLIPLGQSAGQRITAAIESALVAAGETGMAADLDDIGGALFLTDMASMLHETQYTRLFRS